MIIDRLTIKSPTTDYRRFARNEGPFGNKHRMQSLSPEQNTLPVADLLRIEFEQVRHNLLLIALEADAVGGLDCCV